MYRFKLIFLLLILLASAGCSCLPFKNIDYVALNDVNPDNLLQEFKGFLAQKLQVINSIVFEYKWQSFSALGYTQLDLENNTFQVSCMNPVGIKLFELTGNENTINSNFILKELLQKGDLPRAVGEDIRRIYFNMLPSSQAKIEKEKYRIIFSQPIGSGQMKYIFGGSHHWLIEKHYSEKNRKLWSVFYYDYLMDKGRLYPAGLILKHYRFGYNLIIRLKEVR
ncbi:MAG: DUF3261 domain-containing protein [Candidatus Omnitrophica bacterium]|nr:DUF3261 domain-containing protein [Candidatus Omnitrophota bacterium]